MTPVNLNRARKERARLDDRRQADANAARFGRTRAQRLIEDAEAERARRALDGAKVGAKVEE